MTHRVVGEPSAPLVNSHLEKMSLLLPDLHLIKVLPQALGLHVLTLCKSLRLLTAPLETFELQQSEAFRASPEKYKH